MRLDEISPFVRQATVAKMSLGSYIPYKLRTRDHRLFYIMGGTGNMVIEGKPYPLRPGMVVLFRAGTEYIWQLGTVRYAAINFDYTRAHTHLNKSFHVERAEADIEILEPNFELSDAMELSTPTVLYDAAELEGAIMNIVAEFGLKGNYSTEYLSSLLKSLIISILRRMSMGVNGTTASDSLVREVIGYVGKNYTKPIRNTDIAEALHVNPSYMNRVFKAHTGITVRAFIIDYRINAAIELISGGELSTEELALAVGFTDAPHFIKTFKAHTGKTPKAYRKGR